MLKKKKKIVANNNTPENCLNFMKIAPRLDRRNVQVSTVFFFTESWQKQNRK